MPIFPNNINNLWVGGCDFPGNGQRNPGADGAKGPSATRGPNGPRWPGRGTGRRAGPGLLRVAIYHRMRGNGARRGRATLATLATLGTGPGGHARPLLGPRWGHARPLLGPPGPCSRATLGPGRRGCFPCLLTYSPEIG